MLRDDLSLSRAFLALKVALIICLKFQKPGRIQYLLKINDCTNQMPMVVLRAAEIILSLWEGSFFFCFTFYFWITALLFSIMFELAIGSYLKPHTSKSNVWQQEMLSFSPAFLCMVPLVVTGANTRRASFPRPSANTRSCRCPLTTWSNFKEWWYRSAVFVRPRLVGPSG